MSASAWADYLDARLRLVIGWFQEGMSAVAIAQKLTPEAEQIERLFGTPTEPPIPGCSRAMAQQWKERCDRLEKMLAARGGDEISVAPASQPLPSQVRSLATHPDPYVCGCQYWVERPREGEHHPECEHAPKP